MISAGADFSEIDMRILPFALGGAAVILCAAGCRTPHEPTHFELAENARASGDKVTALREYEECLRLEPRHKYAWLNVGYIKNEKIGGKEYTKTVRDALNTFLALETYETGNVAGDVAYGIPESPTEPHMARRVRNAVVAVIRALDQIEFLAEETFAAWRMAPEDAELKSLTTEAWQAALDANLGQSPKCHYYLGEIARLSGEDAGAKGHFETALAQAKEMGYNYRRAQARHALVGGDLDEGWLAIREENNLDLYLAYAEAAVKAGQLDRALMGLKEARTHYVDIRIWRALAEAHLLAGNVESANSAIRTLERWNNDNPEATVFIRMCSAALAGQKVDQWSKEFAKHEPGAMVFNPARLAAHVDGSATATGDAKKAVRKAADAMVAK
jgi:tetratricopeptide (TPR) repeat protein